MNGGEKMKVKLKDKQAFEVLIAEKGFSKNSLSLKKRNEPRSSLISKLKRQITVFILWLKGDRVDLIQLILYAKR